MAIEMAARPAPSVSRLPARSAIAGADVALARRTLAQLADQPGPIADAGGRMLGRLRRLMGGPEGHHSSS